MSIGKRQKKLTIIIIQDERRLCSFNFPMSFLTIFLITIIGLSIVSVIAVLLHNRLRSLNREEFTARVETQLKAVDARNNKTETSNSIGNAVAENYSLSIENLRARFDLTKQSFRYTFLLKNKNSENATASGYIFAILKSAWLGSEHWLVNPQTVLLNGVPQKFKDGDSFSIVKHKVINKKITTQYSYDTLEIFVFSNEGNLVLREIFNLKN